LPIAGHSILALCRKPRGGHRTISRAPTEGASNGPGGGEGRWRSPGRQATETERLARVR